MSWFGEEIFIFTENFHMQISLKNIHRLEVICFVGILHFKYWNWVKFEHTALSTVPGLLRRIRKANRFITVRTLKKLIHELPARFQEIYRMKGDRMHAS